MRKKHKGIFKSFAVLVLVIALVNGMALSLVADNTGDQKADKIPASVQNIKQEPVAPGTGTVLKDVFDPTSTHAGKIVEKTIKVANVKIESARTGVIANNMVPKTKQAAKRMNTLLAKRKNIEKALTSAPGATKKGLRHWTKALSKNTKALDKVNKVLSKGGALKAGAMKFAGGGLRVMGVGYNIYSIGTDANKIYKGEYEHKHTSMRFISDALRSGSIAINAASTATLGKVPIIEGAAIITGVAKDLFTSETFSSYMNSTDNVVIRGADRVVGGVLHYGGMPVRAVTESITLKWWRFNGNYPTDEKFAELEEIHERYLEYKKSDEYKEKMKNIKLNNRPAKDVPALKPNIYLYTGRAGETLDVHVSFVMPGLLEAVIPDYPEEWLVTVDSDGRLIAKSGEEYDFLFYESMTWPFLFQKDEGWLLKKEDRAEQFGEILTAYGFNQKEIYDFIEFWDEKLDRDADYAMYPQLTGAIDVAMPIKVSPEPDNIFRLWFTFDKDAVPECEADIVPFIRDGFTLVEWGGVIL